MNSMSYNTFPQNHHQRLRRGADSRLPGPSLVTFGSHNASVTLSKFVGHHTTKAGPNIAA